MKQLRRSSSQSGLASIVVVFMLVIVLGLVSVGFATLTDRANHVATSTNLNSAAYLAARAGINDAVSYISQNTDFAQTYNDTASNCQSLTATGKPLASLTTLDTGGTTKYTCVLINPKPTQLLYQNIPPYKSHVTYVTPGDSTDNNKRFGSFMISWQSPADKNLIIFPPHGNTKFLDEKTWGNKGYAPVLELSVQAIPYGFSLRGATNNLETFYLYPQVKGGSGNVTQIQWGAGDGLIPVDCDHSHSLATPNFEGSADFDCNAIINTMPVNSAFSYFIRMRPLYTNADVKIKANTPSNTAYTFAGQQYVVDVTARSGQAVKRLQATVDLPYSVNGGGTVVGPSDNAIPEFALQTTNTICKRLLNNRDLNKTIIDGLNCNFQVQ